MGVALFLFAEIHPEPKHYAEALHALEQLLAPTRAEAGCRRFTLHEGEARDRLYLYETFDDQAALDAHYAQPYTRAVFERYEAWLAEPVRIHRLRPPHEA